MKKSELREQIEIELALVSQTVDEIVAALAAFRDRVSTYLASLDTE